MRMVVVLVGLSLACAPATSSVDLAIVHVTTVDVERGRVHPDQTILVSGDRIVGILPAGEAEVPATADVLDGTDLFAIPGLWDMHVHALWDTTVAANFLAAFARHGITGVRDMGGDMAVLGWVRSIEASERTPWPRIVAAGSILDGPEPVSPDISVAVSNPEDGTRAVQDLVSAGADFIKVYTLLPRDAFFAILEAATALGVPVVGHVPGSVSVREAVEAGQIGIEHLRDELGAFCTPGAEAACDSLIQTFRTLGVSNTPTLVVLEAKGIPGYQSPEDRETDIPVPDLVRALWQDSRRSHSERPETYFDGRKEIFEREMNLVARIDDAGAPLLAGSDAGNPFIFPGPGLHRELELLVLAGLTPRAALATATTAAARFLGVSDSIGVLCNGCVADIVLLRGNPLERISSIRQIAGVVLRGEVLDFGVQQPPTKATRAR